MCILSLLCLKKKKKKKGRGVKQSYRYYRLQTFKYHFKHSTSQKACRHVNKEPKAILNCRFNPDMSSSYQPGGIKMTLENAHLWQSFHSVGTEMIITKHGRRMFPHCGVRVSGLQPFANYVVMLDIIPLDGFKYKWKKEQWEVAGLADPHPPCRTYMHPDSPAPGSHWMKQPVSFPKLKLTNNTLNQHSHVRPFFFFFLPPLLKNCMSCWSSCEAAVLTTTPPCWLNYNTICLM
uniref:T-box domain-containing protein n=1 Tax=Amphilophus citrinellus TaxID=61819 RepID=A0A3Q0RHD5_AMPCI